MDQLLQVQDPSDIGVGVFLGLLIWFVIRHVLGGFFTVDQNERAVITSFGRAQRVLGATTAYEVGAGMRDSEKERYDYPQLRVIQPGGPYFKWPWQKVHKVSVATRTINMAMDLEEPQANYGGTMLEAVTKDQLNTGLKGELRYKVSEANLYPYLFAVKNPIVHVMGFFISILRERIANFEAPPAEGGNIAAVVGVSINDLRKNLRRLNEVMDAECAVSTPRYGITLDASLITAIDPPAEVESALAAINTAHNHVSSDISLAQAGADQKIVQSHRAVEIETLKAQAESEPLVAQAEQLKLLKASGPGALEAYLRNVRLSLHARAERAIMHTSGPSNGEVR
jgi:regulator of protease activity HflC (stomatin/prohibitin superfamily)